MSENMRIWDALSKTDPKHTKQFKRAGGFQGTATKPIWLNKRLTEHFGPCGTGWGMEKPEFEFVTAGNEILVFCTVALWYRETGAAEGMQSFVYGVGGDKVLGTNKYGPFTNDEAAKASYTDALSNAMKQIGVAADIHMGQFDDEKYVREMTREFANDAAGTHKPGEPGSAAGGGDFRPERRGLGVMAAATNSIRDARADIERDGPGPATVKSGVKPAATKPTPAEQRAAKVKGATDKRIDILKNTSAWTRPTLDQFWADNKVWIDWMADSVNGALEEYERFTTAFSDAEVNMREVA